MVSLFGAGFVPTRKRDACYSGVAFWSNVRTLELPNVEGERSSLMVMEDTRNYLPQRGPCHFSDSLVWQESFPYFCQIRFSVSYQI